MIFVATTDFVGQFKLAQSIADDVVLQSYIDREETKQIRRLLGKDLGDAIIAYQQLTKTITTSGVLVVGVLYTITNYIAGDDFTNVGAASNATGVSFVATGTTPTTWTNASTVSNHIDRYDNIIAPFYVESLTGSCGEPYYDSAGIKNLLIIIIYYYFIFETQNRHTQNGVTNQSTENGTVLSVPSSMRLGEMKWNTEGLTTWTAIRWYCYTKYYSLYPEYNGVQEKAKYTSII